MTGQKSTVSDLILEPGLAKPPVHKPKAWVNFEIGTYQPIISFPVTESSGINYMRFMIEFSPTTELLFFSSSSRLAFGGNKSKTDEFQVIGFGNWKKVQGQYIF